MRSRIAVHHGDVSTQVAEAAEASAPRPTIAVPMWVQHRLLNRSVLAFPHFWFRLSAMLTLFDQSRLSAQPPDERTDTDAPSGVDPAQRHSPLVERGDGVQESEPDTTALARKLLAAIEQAKVMLAAHQEPVAVAPAPPTREVPRPSSFDLEAALAAVEQATTEEEAMAAMKAFVDGAETVVKAASDPLAALAAIFGSECVATVTGACAAAVVDLEAEEAATGGPVTDRAASRIVRTMIQRVTRRADSTMAHALRARPVPRARTLRAPRARRAPRRAVRLSAVASAGDGPPPPSPDSHARTLARDTAPTVLARVWAAHALTLQVGATLAASRGQPESVLPRGVRLVHAASCAHPPLSWFAAVRPPVAIGRMRRSRLRRASRATHAASVAVHQLPGELRDPRWVLVRGCAAEALRPAAGRHAAVTELHEATQSVVRSCARRRRRKWPSRLLLEEVGARLGVNS